MDVETIDERKYHDQHYTFKISNACILTQEFMSLLLILYSYVRLMITVILSHIIKNTLNNRIL